MLGVGLVLQLLLAGLVLGSTGVSLGFPVRRGVTGLLAHGVRVHV